MGCNTIDMQSNYSQTKTEHYNIQFPKKMIIIQNNTNTKNTTSSNYEVYPSADRFDPNIVSSPPNEFVSTLKQRMNVYYSNPRERSSSEVRLMTGRM